MSCNGMAILFREANCHTRPTVSWGLNRDSAALVPCTLMLYVFSTSIKAFVVDSRFVFKSRLKQQCRSVGRGRGGPGPPNNLANSKKYILNTRVEQ